MSESTQYRFWVTQSEGVEVTSEGEILELQLRSLSPVPLMVWHSPKEWVATDCNGHTRSVRRTRRFPVPQFVIGNGCDDPVHTPAADTVCDQLGWWRDLGVSHAAFPSGLLGFFHPRSLTLREHVARKPLGSLC